MPNGIDMLGNRLGQNATCEMAVVDAQNYMGIIAVSIPMIEQWIAIKDIENLKQVIDDWKSGKSVIKQVRQNLINCGRQDVLNDLNNYVAQAEEVIGRAKSIARPIPIWAVAGGAALLGLGAVFLIKKRKGGFSEYDCGCH